MAADYHNLASVAFGGPGRAGGRVPMGQRSGTLPPYAVSHGGGAYGLVSVRLFTKR